MVPVVEGDVRNHWADTHLDSGLAGVRGEPVLVIEGGGSCLYHLQAGHFCAPVNVFSIDFGLCFPDFRKPFRKRNVFFNASHQCHGSVGVHVNEARHRCPAFAVHHFHA